MTDEPAPKPGADAGDPSMEEILASIRRILNEETNPEAPASTDTPEEADDVLLLDEAMLVSAQETSAMPEPQTPEPQTPEPQTPEPQTSEPETPASETSLDPAPGPAGMMTPEPLATQPLATQPLATQPDVNAEVEPTSVNPLAAALDAADPAGGPTGLAVEAQSSLVAPEAAAAAATSVGTLVRTLAGRGTQVYSGGPTLEDMVRAELRPLLKEWLDTNLPPLVERLVRAEIERVVGRAVP